MNAFATPFTIDIPDSELDDLRRRLALTRWPNVVDDDAEEHGVSLSALRSLADYWTDAYDWRRQEARLNGLRQFTAVVGDERIHLVHEVGATSEDAVPVLLLHGWPDSFLRYRDVVPLLTSAGHDVVVPSLPGFAFSGQPSGALSLAYVAGQLHDLMAGLGYDRYAVHGGDWGAAVAEQLTTSNAEAVVAMHLTDVPFSNTFAVDRSGLSDAEAEYLNRSESWAESASYFTVQSNDPTAMSVGLTDSPIALAAWHLGKFRSWSEAEIPLDDVLTNVMLHWLTGTSRSAMRLYSEAVSWDADAWSEDSDGPWEDGTGWGVEPDVSVAGGESGGWGSAPDTPTALAVFPRDISTAPREFAERFYNVRRFTVMPRGGHFAALEEPKLLAEDIVEFLRQ